jgi:hypothetical protein
LMEIDRDIVKSCVSELSISSDFSSKLPVL